MDLTPEELAAQEAAAAAANANPPVGDPPAATLPEGMIQVDKFIQEDWKQYIPEDLKERAEFGRVNSLTDVFKNYVEGQQTISKSVRLPDATSTAEEITAFYSKLGKPASKDEYDFEYKPENESYKLTKDAFDFSVFKEAADAGNLTKTQYEALGAKFLDIQNENVIKIGRAHV